MSALLGGTKQTNRQVIGVYIDKGIIRMTMPEKSTSVGQRYIAVNSTADTTLVKAKKKVVKTRALTLSAETLQEFCRTPRTRQEVAEHFGLKIYIA
jgi:hypothetical protein